MVSKIYIFKNVDWCAVPNCARKDLADIYAECVENYQFGFPTIESIQYAADLYDRSISSGPITPEEKKLLTKMKRMPWTNKLYMAALDEFKQYMDAMFQNVLGVNFKFFVNPYHATKQVIFLDYLIRHPGIMGTYNKLSRLRCKTRKLCNLSSTDYVGF